MEGQKTSGIMGNPASSKFTWKIPGFSQLSVEKLYSDIFVAGDCKWRLLIFPKGNAVDYLSLYLDVADSTSLPNGWSRDAELSLAVVNQFDNSATVTKKSRHVYTAGVEDWGFTSFIPLCKIRHPFKRYLVKDTLTVEGEVLVHSAMHYSKIENEKEIVKSETKAPVPKVGGPAYQTPSTAQKAIVATEAEDPASEPVQSAADVLTVSKLLLTELSSRSKKQKSCSSNEFLGSSQAPESTDIWQQHKEALQGFFNMSLEAIQKDNCFVKIEGILCALVQHTNNLQEKSILEDVMSHLAEFKESTPNYKAIAETAQARRTSLGEKTADLDSKLGQRQKELSSLESDFSTLSEEEAKLKAEIERLTAQKEEIERQKKSVSFKLERANEETSKEIEEWRSLEGEMKQANVEWLGAKEKLASANVRWKLLRENLGLGKLNIC